VPVNIKPGPGGHKDHSLIAVDVLSVACVTYFAQKGALSRMPRDILKPIFFTVKGAASVPVNAGPKL
jgi:hypothetical protein